MITLVHGDLFTSPARVLVNPVNTVGTMAGEVGEDFRQVYPEMFARYQALCESDALTIGQAYLYRTPHKWVLNLPVKKHYRASIRLEAVETALRKIATLYAEQLFVSLSLPVAALIENDVRWDDVLPLLHSYLGTLPIMVYVHLPADPRLPEARYNVTTLSRWLLGTPQHVTYDTFWRGLSSIVRRHPQLTTLEGDVPFQATFRRDAANPRLMSLKLTPAQGEEMFIPQSLLRDLWQYLLTSGYAHPRHLPGGLDSGGAMVVALLSRLSYVRPLLLQPTDQPAAIGVHYTPPAERELAPVTHELRPVQHPSSA